MFFQDKSNWTVYFAIFTKKTSLQPLNPTFQLLKLLLLMDFPSGSSINYYNEKLYLVGDDASHILILDSNYEKVDSIKLFDHSEKRIPKTKKRDFEASTVVTDNGKSYLLVLGSASRESRKKVMLVPLLSSTFHEPSFTEYYDGEFITRLVASGIQEVNIEGVTLVGDRIVLANRGNSSNPKNHLIVTESNFWEKQKESRVNVSRLLSPAGRGGFIGISALFYLKQNDVLLVTLSSEVTSNSYDDGAIGNSYIAWIDNITQKINNPDLKLDGLINLADADKAFKGEKIEGICVESTMNEEFILHLISDNDKGESKLFKVKMDLKR
jgi:hypothetical protein